MNSKSISRRLLLQGVGAAGLLAPLLSQSRPARGAEPQKRLILFHTASAIEPIKDTPPAFVSQIDDLLILDGVDWKANMAVNSNEAHMMGPHGAFTGHIGGDTFAKGPSIDRYLINALQPGTMFDAVDLGVHTDRDIGAPDQAATINYSMTGGSIQVETSPSKAFDRLFSGVVVAGPDNEAALARLRARKQSILDHVIGELGTLSPKLTPNERIRVDAHLTSLRAIETRLSDPMLVNGAGAVGKGPLEEQITLAGADPTFPIIGELHTDIIVLAMAMGLTNYATLRWSHAVNGVRHTWIGSNRTMHQELAHRESGPGAAEEFVKVIYWYADQYLALVNGLKQTPDPTGMGTLFDNSLVVWNSDMATSNHGWENAVMVLAGRLGGAVRTGRVQQMNGGSLNGIYADICAAMGAPTEAFGNPDVDNSPLNCLA